MRKPLRILAASWSEILAYRVDVLIWTIAEAMVPLVALTVWLTVSTTGNLALGPREAITYYIAIFFVKALTNAWTSFWLTKKILNGDLAKDLVRPVWPFWEHIGENLAVKGIRMIVPVTLILAIIIAVPHLIAFETFTATNTALAIISLLLAMVLAFAFDSIFAMLAFWIEDSFQIIRFQEIFYQIASGVLIPYAVMPAALLATLSWLPFRYMVSAPVEILMGTIPAANVTQLFTLQATWILISIALASMLWHRGLKTYAPPGQ